MPKPAILRRKLSRSSTGGHSHSFSSNNSSAGAGGGSSNSSNNGDLAAPVLVYHANARSIVFRDQLRRANSSSREASFAEPGESTAAAAATAATEGPCSSPPVSPNPYAKAAAGEKTTPTAPTSPPPPVAVVDTGCGIQLPFPEKVDGVKTFLSHHSPIGGVRASSSSHHSVDSYVVTDDPEHRHVDKIATAGASVEHIFQSAVDADRDLHITEQVPNTQIAGYCERVQPLPTLELGPNDNFQPLLDQDLAAAELTAAESEVVQLLQTQQACAKTIKNTDWTAFLQRFLYAQPPLHAKRPSVHDDAPPSSSDRARRFNSFVTSTTLLPPSCLKMRCYGSTSQYTTGAIFALPESDSPEAETEATKATSTWSWPAGYSAKTEFNRDSRGRLINGREEALVSLSTLREYNVEYVEGTEYTVNQRRVSGISQIPYNEVFLRVGGVGRIVDGRDATTGEPAARSFKTGVGLPVALFCRQATFGALISLLRTRARVVHTLGESHKDIPLLLIAPDLGIRVVTESVLQEMWKVAAHNLTPFQNSTIAHRTVVHVDDDSAFQQKLDELIDLDESMREVLTPEELARIAGGFGASDDSLAAILKQVQDLDEKVNSEKKENGDKSKTSHKLQDVVNEGLAYAVRSGDYHTSRQLLILYSLVAAHPDDSDDEDGDEEKKDGAKDGRAQQQKTGRENSKKLFHKSSSMSMSTPDTKLHLLDSSGNLSNTSASSNTTVSIHTVPPPPPLDTDRLRGATNSDGLLSVLGAAQVLRAMQDGGAKKRTEEAISAVEEWVNYGEQSMAFRISSWYDQRAAQGDLKIATEGNSQFMAFVSNKAISNRKAFCQQLRDAAASTNFNDVRFLQSLHLMLSKMHSPCLRLELLQYVLGLDNRYSVEHISRSIELAATCLGISSAAPGKEKEQD